MNKHHSSSVNIQLGELVCLQECVVEECHVAVGWRGHSEDDVIAAGIGIVCV